MVQKIEFFFPFIYNVNNIEIVCARAFFLIINTFYVLWSNFVKCEKHTKTDSKASFGIKNSANLLITNIFHVSELKTIVTSLLSLKKISSAVKALS